MNAHTKSRYVWKPLRRAEALPASEELIAATMKHTGGDREAALASLDGDAAELWLNDLYQVQVRPGEGNAVHINIRRRDGGPILRDWRHFQQIKNELLGPECEAVELYPAESRLVDASNKYHLWGVRDPKYRFPLGFVDRCVSYEQSKLPGHRQRPL